MTTYPSGEPMSEADEAIYDRGFEFTNALMDCVSAWSEVDQTDIRVLAIAFGNAFGCYVRAIENKEIRTAVVRNFCATFFACADVPLRVEGVS